jgi:hypothetical protein
VLKVGEGEDAPAIEDVMPVWDEGGYEPHPAAAARQAHGLQVGARQRWRQPGAALACKASPRCRPTAKRGRRAVGSDHPVADVLAPPSCASMLFCSVQLPVHSSTATGLLKLSSFPYKVELHGVSDRSDISI